MEKNHHLAICGGTPVRTNPWPKWPIVYKETENHLHKALHSGRWAISGPYLGEECFERKFAKKFSAFTGANYSVPTVNGTSALTMALLALKIQPGDEVLVPALTWVATASSVISLGAIPILVDIDSRTLCMSYEDAKKKITSATKAIILVHLYNSVANLNDFIEFSEKNNLVLIEDCAQAHGARWEDRHVGTFGQIGCFSMQQSKLLTSGEGGAVITNDPYLYQLLEQVRSDGRSFLENSEREIGRLELKEVGEIQGHNMCMSEFHAAILLAGLEHLENENKKRSAMANHLNRRLESEGIGVITPHSEVTEATYYNYVFRLDLDQFGGNTIDAIARALSAELGASVNTIYRPLNSHPLYSPLNSSRLSSDSIIRDRINPASFRLPNAEKARATCLSLHHSLLLDTEEGMDDILSAIIKVRKHNEELSETMQKTSSISF